MTTIETKTFEKSSNTTNNGRNDVKLDDNFLDFLKFDEVRLVVYGYFWSCKFLEYNIKCDDFIKIIAKYINHNSITIGDDHKIINFFDNKAVHQVDSLNKDFIIVSNRTLQQMLSNHQA